MSMSLDPSSPSKNAVRVLIVDDDATTRRALTLVVSRSGWDPVPVGDSRVALELLADPAGPRIALVDWMMPDVTGPELCQRLRAERSVRLPYLILVTVLEEPSDIVAGLDAGADDYLVKPIDAGELRARVRVGLRTVELRDRVIERAQQLEKALAEVRQLRRLLPTCSYCRRIRDDANTWQSLEEYVGRHTNTTFSHGFCPDCFSRHVQPQLDEHRDAAAQGVKG